MRLLTQVSRLALVAMCVAGFAQMAPAADQYFNALSFEYPA